MREGGEDGEDPACAIARLRAEVDELDRELIGLLHRRASLALALGRWKRRGGLALKDSQREGEVRDLAAADRGDFPQRAVQDVFSLLFSTCLALQEEEALSTEPSYSPTGRRTDP